MSPLACIVPPDLLHEIARTTRSAALRRSALDSLAIDAAIRLRRAENAARTLAPPRRGPHAGSGTPQRFIHDQHNNSDQTPGPVVRAEGQPAVDDPAVNQAYDNFGATYEFYWEVLHRDSIDDQGMPIHGMVHLRHRLQQRLLGRRRPHVVRRRRRHDVLRLHQEPRRHRARAHPRRHPVHGQPGLQRPVGRAQRVDLRRVRLARQAVRAQADRRPGRLADRRRHRRAGARAGAAFDEGPGHREPVRQAARGHERLRHHQPRQRRRPHQLRHPEPGVLPRGHAPSAASRGRPRAASGTPR